MANHKGPKVTRAVMVYDLDAGAVLFPSLTLAAWHLGTTPATLDACARQRRPYAGMVVQKLGWVVAR